MAEDTSRPSGANKYSIYAQKSVDSTQVNWNKISGELVKGLDTIRAERQAKKDLIEKTTQESIEQLSKVPETGTQDGASLIINGSAMAVEAVRVQNNLMKRGLISPKDNMLFMQQQKTGFKSLSTAVKGWDDWAVEARKRLSDPNISSGNLETFTNLQTEALGNLRNKKIWSNPTNGKLQLVTMGKNTKTGLYDVMPDYETRKQDYQDPNTMMDFMKYQNAGVDVNELAKKQTANIAEIVTAERERLTALGGGGGITSFEDFRQLGVFGKDENGEAVTYDMWKKDQINAMVGTNSDVSNLNAAEMLTNSGYYFAQTKSQFEIDHPGVDEKFMIKVDMSTGQPVAEMNSNQIKQARKLADVAIESQVSHIVKMTEGKGAQQEDQDTVNTTRVKEEEDRNKAYFKDIDKIITAPANEGAAVSQDRITDMNQQFLNSTNATDRSTKINSIKRGANEIVIDKTVRGVSKPVTVDKFFRDPETDELDLKRPLTSKEIARQIYRELIPRGATEKMSFDDFYDAAIKSGMDFTPKMIKDENGNMIPNKNYGADEDFGTKTEIEKIRNYNSDDFTDLDQTQSMALEFKGIVNADGNSNFPNNFKKAAPVVKKAFTQGLRQLEKVYGSSLDVKIGFNDVLASGDNEITYSYKDPVTGKTVSDKFIYDDDNTKLQSEVDAKINEIIDAYNANQASGKNKPDVSGDTEEKPDMG